MTRLGEWRRPPCALCSLPVGTSASTEEPVMFLREARAWAHWACWRRARGVRVKIDRLGDRGWKSVGQVLAEMEMPPWPDV